ncbi:uncharacterized protein LOC112638308 [Camponotus floridanus]|uniref:uncharacterized protein LOC112638308 n=1 Tax=Camponotus floridanus TaxID=104421 RepID=UPI000DC6CD66|nr:uncharacterized protein LOC112638308 [Camponotus floridanus]
MGGRSISTQVRNLIVRDIQKGLSQRNIAKNYEVSRGAVEQIRRKFQSTGSVADRIGRGRKRATSKREDMKIIREVKKNPKITVREIQENIYLTVSDRTMKANSSYLDKRSGLESGENTAKSFKIVIQKTVKYGGGNILVWGCFSWAGVGNLVKINGIMTADVYIDIINENLEECLLKLGLEDNFIFQQDNDPKHTAKKSQAFFRSCRIKQLEWPPQSPDLNPIENLWAILDNRINKSGVTNKNSYFEALQLAWENLDPQHLKNLIESIPKRLQKVLIAMETGIIPPTIHFKRPRKDMTAIIEGRVKIVTEPTE